MTYTVECSLEDFPAWSGGLDRLNELRAKGGCEEVEQFLKECSSEPLSDTDINDYLWFDVEQDFPQYFKEEDEEDEEDEEED